MGMELGEIEPAFFELKEEIENGGIVADAFEMRIIELEKFTRKINANIAAIYERLKNAEERLAAVDAIFMRAVGK